MKIKRGIEGGLFAVFSSNIDAERWGWLFWNILRRRVACYGQYENAYQLI